MDKPLLAPIANKKAGEHLTETLCLAGLTTGEAIREYLRTSGRGNPYGFFKIFRQFKESTSYLEVGKFFWVLKEIGLISPSGTEPSKSGFRKRMYEIAGGKAEDPAWGNAYAELYPGKRDYRKLKARGLKPRSGRARKYRS